LVLFVRIGAFNRLQRIQIKKFSPASETRTGCLSAAERAQQ
jgi:hypothetical protein